MDTNLIDLHVHSCYSDGEMEPNELIRYGKMNNVKTIAITDHDTVLGNQKIDFNNKDFSDMRIITGTELTAHINYGRMHILGYNIDIYNHDLNKTLKEVKINNINSILNIIDQIKKDYNILFPIEEIDYLTKKVVGNVGRPDIAKLCIKYGYASTVQEAFDRYLISAYEKTRKDNKHLLPEECINLITGANGIAVLAHPYTLERNEKELLILIKELIKNGLQGIEVYHSNISQYQTELYQKIAKEYNLLSSGGTDYHGPLVKPNIKIGTGKNSNIKIKSLSLLEKI